jgi:hypothetical protein
MSKGGVVLADPDVRTEVLAVPSNSIVAPFATVSDLFVFSLFTPSQLMLSRTPINNLSSSFTRMSLTCLVQLLSSGCSTSSHPHSNIADPPALGVLTKTKSTNQGSFSSCIPVQPGSSV